MTIPRVYRLLLRMYPHDYVEQFGAEVTSVFVQASADHLKQGRMAFLRFVIRELAGLAGSPRRS